MKRLVKFSMLVLSIFMLLCVGKRTEASQLDNHVLFISSYNYEFDTVPLQIDGIKEILSEEAVIDYEFMDTKTFLYEEMVPIFKQLLEKKIVLKTGSSLLSSYYDVIIVADDNALTFAMDNDEEDELFYQVPVCFLAINSLELASEAANLPFYSGVAEKFSYKETLEIAVKLNPKAKRIVGIVDDSSTGKGDQMQFADIKSSFPDYSFKVYNMKDYSYDELATELNNIGNDSVVLYMSCFQDKNNVTKSMKEASKFIVSNTNVPVYRSSIAGLGEGLIGGVLVSYEAQGRIAASMALRVINGEDIANIPLIPEGPTETIFDNKVLKKFDLNKSLLPSGTILINKTQSVYQKNKALIWSIIIICLISMFSIGCLLISNLKRHKINKQLEGDMLKIQKLATHDTLTELPNRRKLVSKVEYLSKLNKRFGLVVIDVDNFKVINDKYGHLNGDLFLQQLATRFFEVRNDFVRIYRFGGDEFVAVVSNNELRVIEENVELIKNCFEKPFLLDGKAVTINCSIGVSIFPNDAEDFNVLLTKADQALYSVKNNSKNDVRYYKDIVNK